MKVTNITVTAGRVFNHPHEEYSNLRPEVVLQASLEEGDDFHRAAKDLQLDAESLVEDHKQNLLRSIEELYQLSVRQAEVQGLERELRRAQERLAEIRKENPALVLTNGDDESPADGREV